MIREVRGSEGGRKLGEEGLNEENVDRNGGCKTVREGEEVK